MVISTHEIKRQLKVFAELTTKLAELKSDLLVSNPNQWVGIGEDRDVVLADSLYELVSLLRANHDQDYVIAVDYLDTDPLPLVV